MTRGSTGLVGQNTSCRVHKVCISLWPTGWDDVEQERTSRHFKLAGQERKVTEAWWKICFDCVVV